MFWKDEKYSVMNATKNKKRKSICTSPVGELSVIYAHVWKFLYFFPYFGQSAFYSTPYPIVRVAGMLSTSWLSWKRRRRIARLTMRDIQPLTPTFTQRQSPINNRQGSAGQWVQTYQTFFFLADDFRQSQSWSGDQVVRASLVSLRLWTDAVLIILVLKQ